ncbi:peptidase M20 [Paenibacillus sp. 598K]|uniref:M20/M25/M40 family metallo-hydrolase n=1 Tax=Paenibacillus sp. 598K TaxID=1117987 RepID=UPI000FFA9CC4|nr:M20/M25/M40 family metallo-hydrolase [Paenibacillus sp. 598K]GBF78460.1 peptidase M20 [Paenibacillus sp. 598K]
MTQDIAYWREQVFARITEERLTELVLELCNIPSPYGYEKEAGQYVYDWMKREGFAPRKVGLTEERFNVIGTLRGAGHGRNLLFSSHLDTAGPSGSPHDTWLYRDLDARFWHQTWLEDGVFYGQSVENDKGPMACFLLAAQAIKEAGAPLLGDVILTACPGEMGQEPVDEFVGLPYVSKETGAEYMMVHGGIMADYGIAAEGTDFGVSWVEAGKAFFKMTVLGSGVYTPVITHTAEMSRHVNPIVKAAALIERLNDWAIAYERQYTRTYPGGTVIPKVQIGAIKGGHPHFIIGGADSCSLYLDCRLLPGMKPAEVAAQLRRVIRESGVEAELELFLFRQGYEAGTEEVAPFVDAVRASHQAVFEQELELSAPVFSSMWRDHSVFNEYGVPSITYGPPRRTPSLDDLMACARAYAAIALEVCMQEAHES